MVAEGEAPGLLGVQVDVAEPVIGCNYEDGVLYEIEEVDHRLFNAQELSLRNAEVDHQNVKARLDLPGDILNVVGHLLVVQAVALITEDALPRPGCPVLAAVLVVEAPALAFVWNIFIFHN